MTYSEKLKDPRWQKKRLEILSRDNFECQICLNNKLTLHVHHKKYISGVDPWDYENNFLMTICEECHKRLHFRGEFEYDDDLEDEQNCGDLEYFMIRSLLLFDFNLVLTEIAILYDLNDLENKTEAYSQIEYLLKTYLDIEQLGDQEKIKERIDALKIFLKMDK
jgi:hypothetical protein